jgi:hypothetical protein
VIVLQTGAIILVSGKYAMEGVRIAPKGENYMLVGPEYNLVLIAMCLCLLVLGGGVASLDRMIVARWAGTKSKAATPPSTPTPPLQRTATRRPFQRPRPSNQLWTNPPAQSRPHKK